MKAGVGVAVLSGLMVTILAWVFAFRSESWAAPITQSLFIPGALLVLALTPAQHSPDLATIILGYAVNFIFTWAALALAVGFILRLIARGRMSA
jgi:hypothetical protein